MHRAQNASLVETNLSRQHQARKKNNASSFGRAAVSYTHLDVYKRQGRQSGKQSNLTENFDSSVESYAFAPDSRTIYFNAEEKAEMPIYSIATAPGSSPKVIVSGNSNDDFDVSADGRTLVFARTSLTMPPETVSYTHLDVYKRQESGFALSQRLQHP